MEKVISHDEVDALLKGISDGEIEPGPAAAEMGRAIRPYDLTSQERVLRGRMPTLEILNDRFVRIHGASLSASLRKSVDLAVTKPNLMRFGDFLRPLSSPTSLHIVKMDPMHGHALVAIESLLIFNLMDRFFGGTGKNDFEVEGRDFTLIEERIIGKLIQMILKDLNSAWQSAIPITFQLVRSEVNSQCATIVAPTDLAIVSYFALQLDRPLGKVILCLPCSTIEPIRSRLYGGYRSDQPEVDLEWIERLKRRMLDVEVGLVAELGTATVKGRDLLHLEVGDVLLLDQEVRDPLMVSIEGYPKFKAKPGISKGNQACQVTEVILPSVPQEAPKRIRNHD